MFDVPFASFVNSTRPSRLQAGSQPTAPGTCVSPDPSGWTTQIPKVPERFDANAIPLTDQVGYQSLTLPFVMARKFGPSSLTIISTEVPFVVYEKTTSSPVGEKLGWFS